MLISESISRDATIVFARGERDYTFRDVVDWALIAGHLYPLWREFRHTLECDREAEKHDLEADDDAVSDASIQFRYKYDLITAEETEKWLGERGLDLSDFSAHFVRKYWGQSYSGEVATPDVSYEKASAEEKDLFLITLIVDGEMERLSLELSRRVAAEVGAEPPAAAEVAAVRADFLARAKIEKVDSWLRAMGRDEAWLDETLKAEAIYRKSVDALTSEKELVRELNPLRLLMTRFEIETVEVDSKDAASEVVACVRDDGMQMEEVATEGRYPFNRHDVLLEDIAPETQPRFLSVKAGTLMEPVGRGEGYEVMRVTVRTEPTLADPAVRTRLEQRLSARHFSEIIAKRIAWRIMPQPAE